MFIDEPDEDFFYDNEIEGDDTCPNCGKHYDQVDYEYQICHHCGFNNNPPLELIN